MGHVKLVENPTFFCEKRTQLFDHGDYFFTRKGTFLSLDNWKSCVLLGDIQVPESALMELRQKMF
jgi:hypothetical protein